MSGTLVRMIVQAWLITLTLIATGVVRQVGDTFEELSRWRWQFLVDPLAARVEWCAAQAPRGNTCSIAVEWRQNGRWEDICLSAGRVSRVARYWRLSGRCEIALPLIAPFPLVLTQEIFG